MIDFSNSEQFQGVELTHGITYHGKGVLENDQVIPHGFGYKFFSNGDKHIAYFNHGEPYKILESVKGTISYTIGHIDDNYLYDGYAYTLCKGAHTFGMYKHGVLVCDLTPLIFNVYNKYVGYTADRCQNNESKGIAFGIGSARGELDGFNGIMFYENGDVIIGSFTNETLTKLSGYGVLLTKEGNSHFGVFEDGTIIEEMGYKDFIDYYRWVECDLDEKKLSNLKQNIEECRLYQIYSYIPDYLNTANIVFAIPVDKLKFDTRTKGIGWNKEDIEIFYFQKNIDIESIVKENAALHFWKIKLEDFNSKRQWVMFEVKFGDVTIHVHNSFNAVEFDRVDQFDNLSREDRLDIIHNVESENSEKSFDNFQCFHSFTQILTKSAIGKSVSQIADDLTEEEYENLRGDTNWTAQDVIELFEYMKNRH